MARASGGGGGGAKRGGAARGGAARGEGASGGGAKRGGGKRAAREPTLRDEIAASGETPIDEAVSAEREARGDEDAGFLGREFLTWLVFHADTEGGTFEATDGGTPFAIAFGGRLALRTPAGRVTDVTMKGTLPAGSADVRYALAGGLSVKEADLRLERDDRSYTFALSAEHFDLKRVKLPALLTEEEDEKADERLGLLGALDDALATAFARFLALRTRPTWRRTTVPALRRWLEAGTRP